jgi:hypothetical protein
MKISTSMAGSAVLLASALLLAACGGSSGGSSGGGSGQLTLGKEFPAVEAAAKNATSVRMSGSIVQNGQPISLDMTLVKPSSSAGSVSEGGTSYTIVVTPDKDYIQISKQFLQQSKLPAKLCAKVCGKYLEVSPSSAASFSDLTMTSLVSGVFSKPLSKSEAAIKLHAGQFQGQPAWVGSGGGETFYLAKGGTPYLLSASKQGQTISFSGWNTATVTAPSASQVETTAQLGALVAAG